jgi:hypothetical protein
MMPQKEGSSAIQQFADPEYRRYEGNQTGDSRLHYETSFEQGAREGQFSKVHPLQRDKTNLLCFALAVIALGLLVLFGLLFVVVVGGTAGWVSFAAACPSSVICFSSSVRPLDVARQCLSYAMNARR